MNQEVELLKRITMRPGVFGGKPIIRDMRIAVEHVLANLAAGARNGCWTRCYSPYRGDHVAI